MAGRRILFAIRGKLGDSLACYATVRAYINAHPEDEVWLLIRRNYSCLLEGEPGLRVVPFGSRIEMMIRLLWIRLTRPEFDVLATLWGFGKPVLRIAQVVRARRKIYLDGRYPEAYPEWPAHNHYDNVADPAWFVTRVFDPSAAKPVRLEIPSLARRRKGAPKPGAIGIIPVADERRRTFDAPTLGILLTEVSARHPGRPLWLIVNPNDRGAKELIAMSLPAHVEVKRFPATLADLLLVLFQLDAYYGTDTGIYHLAVAMGIPATVFSGPTQPQKGIMPQQPNVTSVRLAVLGDAHCEITHCTRPLCVYQAVATFAGAECATRLEDTPAECPLRAFDAAQISAISRRENPRH